MDRAGRLLLVLKERFVLFQSFRLPLFARSVVSV
jgi:hypothetical protein